MEKYKNKIIKKSNDNNIPRKFRILDFLLPILPPCIIIISGARDYGLSQYTLAAQQQQTRCKRLWSFHVY